MINRVYACIKQEPDIFDLVQADKQKENQTLSIHEPDQA